MPIKPTVKIEPDDYVRYLLYQQFYYGEDIIYGRKKDLSEYIEGAGDAIECLYNLITKSLYLIDEGHIDQYLEFFNKNIHEVNTPAIMENYRESLDRLDANLNRGMVITLVVGGCLTQIHKICFDEVIADLIKFIMKKKCLEIEQEKDIKKEIETCYSKSIPYIGMIYSLSFMKFIGKKCDYEKIVETCDFLLKKYFELIIDEIQLNRTSKKKIFKKK